MLPLKLWWLLTGRAGAMMMKMMGKLTVSGIQGHRHRIATAALLRRGHDGMEAAADGRATQQQLRERVCMRGRDEAALGYISQAQPHGAHFVVVVLLLDLLPHLTHHPVAASRVLVDEMMREVTQSLRLRQCQHTATPMPRHRQRTRAKNLLLLLLLAKSQERSVPTLCQFERRDAAVQNTRELDAVCRDTAADDGGSTRQVVDGLRESRGTQEPRELGSRLCGGAQRLGVCIDGRLRCERNAVGGTAAAADVADVGVTERRSGKEVSQDHCVVLQGDHRDAGGLEVTVRRVLTFEMIMIVKLREVGSATGAASSDEVSCRGIDEVLRAIEQHDQRPQIQFLLIERAAVLGVARTLLVLLTMAVEVVEQVLGGVTHRGQQQLWYRSVRGHARRLRGRRGTERSGGHENLQQRTRTVDESGGEVGKTSLQEVS